MDAELPLASHKAAGSLTQRLKSLFCLLLILHAPHSGVLTAHSSPYKMMSDKLAQKRLPDGWMGEAF